VRSARHVLKLVQCAGMYWNSDNASTRGAALAFYCAFSLAPLLVIILTVAGWVVGTTAAYAQIGAQLTALFGPATAKTLLDAMRSAQQVQGSFATAVSVITLLFAATTVLAALEGALEEIWRSGSLRPAGIRGWIRTRLLSLGFILSLGFLLLVSLTLSTGLAHLRDRIAAHDAGFVSVIGGLDFLISLLLVSGLFALIFRYMPMRRLPWSVVAGGGVMTAVLFDVGRWIVGLYLARSTQPTAFGAAASFAALLLWLYYTAQIFLFGAEFTACLGGLREHRPEDGAGPPQGSPESYANRRQYPMLPPRHTCEKDSNRQIVGVHSSTQGDTCMTTSSDTSNVVISSNKVEGTKVYNNAGDKLGSIDDLMIDKMSGQIRYAVLEFGGFLGMGTDRYPIPWNMLKYETSKDGYVVPLDKAKLDNAPKYRDSEMPVYDTEYGKRVNTYYGVNW
jgi:membrane protein